MLLLLATLFVAYLTYLELSVIQAICPWCVAYAVTIVVALVTAGLALRRGSPRTAVLADRSVPRQLHVGLAAQRRPAAAAP